MRKSGSWQTVWDERILELASQDEDGTVTVSDLVERDAVRISQSSISRRCHKLTDHDLFRKLGPGTFILTEKGVAYLGGEYDAEAEMFLSDMEDSFSPTGVDSTGTNGA